VLKLLLTRELGRLAKWLRILGLDAEYSREKNNASLIIQALREDRLILTRNHRLPAGRGIRIVVLKEELIRKQVAESLKLLEIPVRPQELFTRCTVCNQALVDVLKEKIKDKVPEYVFQTQEHFRACPKCSRIYWQGSHWMNVEEILKAIQV
jgi:uncharacterized protein with PIN domain